MQLIKYRKYKRMLVFLTDLLIIFLSYLLAMLLFYEFSIPELMREGFYRHIAYISMIYVINFAVFGLYKSLWTVAGYYDYINIVYANFTAVIFLFFYDLLLLRDVLSISIIIIAGGTVLLGSMAIRMFFRVYRRLLLEKVSVGKKSAPGVRNVLIVGAGQAAAMIIKEIRNHPELLMRIAGLVDDSEFKQHSRISGHAVLGHISDIPEIVDHYGVDEILLAMPSASHEKRKEILEIAASTGAKLKTLPGIYEMVDKGLNIKSIRDVEISDLLGRKEIKLNNEKISEYIEGKVVLVTGGGGSIGSELSRQIARLKPKQLIILDIYENNAYAIENELKRNHPELNLLTLIASVRDRKKIERVFKTYHPQTVFHAAAHKHVPLMETSPEEAIKNNVFGTLNVARAANVFGTEKFILISTDKAVNPTNIMGASKRLCEMIVQTMDSISEHTDYVAVRFGNVLGSNGSVIPLFKEQIKNGGPVTLTHKDIVRYFMTIPEAVQLVLQAGSYAEGGEIFVLDMGDPVRIYDLAENLIRLSGFEPHKEIEIKITGLRPGEKLYEELLMAEEGLESTPNELIFVGRPNGFNKSALQKTLEDLEKDIHDDSISCEDLKKIMERIVPTYQADIRKDAQSAS